MRFVNTEDGGLIWPEESITGGASPDHTLLDTGWDWHQAPGHLYLSDRDLVDLVVPALGRDAVADALKLNGWTAPGETAEKVAELEAQLEEARTLYAEAKVAEDGFNKALAKLEAHKKSAAKTPAKAKE